MKRLNQLIMVSYLFTLYVFPKFLCAGDFSIHNHQLQININPKTGTWDCNYINGEKIIQNAAFLIITNQGDKFLSTSGLYDIQVNKSPFTNQIGSGEKLLVQFSSLQKKGIEALLSLHVYQDNNYITMEVEAINTTLQPIHIREIQPILLHEDQNSALHFEGSLQHIKCLMEGYHAGDKQYLGSFQNKESVSGYTTTVLFDPISKKSMILGYLQNHQSINLFALHSKGQQGKLSQFNLISSSYYMYKFLEPGKTVTTGLLLIDLPQNVFDGLENYGELVARINQIKLDKPPLCGWCTWYYVYPDITEAEVLKNMTFAKKHFQDYGMETIQIDRGRIPSGTDWLVDNPKFPHGFKWLAEQIHNNGFKAGIWAAPYWLGRESKFYDEEWVMEKISTRPIQEGGRRRHWASFGDLLDPSNEHVLNYMKYFVNVIINDWKADYIKLDFLGMGLPEGKRLNKVLINNGEIVNIQIRPRSNKKITPIEAYKRSMEVIKDAAGKEIFITGAAVTPFFNTNGYIDACRVGGDVQSKKIVTWSQGTTRIIRDVAKRYFYNGKTVWNDPDAIVINDPCGRGPFTFEQSKVRVAFAALTGGMAMSGDRMYTLTPEKVDLMRKVMPPYPKTARPIDLFEKEVPEVWLWEINKSFDQWYVLGVFNYSDTTVQREITYEYLGLDTTKQFIFYDFWNKKMPTRSSRYYYRTFMPFTKDMALELVPNSCHVIAIHEKKEYPQVLSTNRHISQGAVDLEDVQWDVNKNILSGISRVVKNDHYEMVITLPEKYEFLKVKADIKCQAHLDDPDVDRYNTVKLKMKSKKNRFVNWVVYFTKI